MKRSMDGLEQIIDDAVAQHSDPAPTGDGIRQELSALTAAPDTQAGMDGAPPRSRKGELWDPTIHVDPPEQTVRGTWKRRRDGARADHPARTPQSCAEEVCDFAFGPIAIALDTYLPTAPGWQPSDDERAAIEKELSRFFDQHPDWMVDLPPGFALALVSAQYLLPRVLMLPAVQARLQRRQDKVIASADEPAAQPQPVGGPASFSEAA